MWCASFSPVIHNSSRMELEDRLKQFSYIFARCLEEKLKYWQKYLEDRPDPIDSSKYGTIFATAASAVPTIGKGLASTVKLGDQYIQNRAEKTTAENMAEITYFSDNNKDAFRLILLEGAFEVFSKYEYQFSLVSCKGGALRAVQKLGSDAAHRNISFLLRDKTIQNLTPELVAKGIVLGNSPRNYKKIVSHGRTLTVNDETVSTANFFENTGIRVVNENVITYYGKKDCLPVLRHRLLFSWEDSETIASTYNVDRPEYSYKYEFTDETKKDRVDRVRQFITTKNPIEDIKEFINVKEDELASLITSCNEEMKELQLVGVEENREHHHLTRETIAKTETAIITYLYSMICETLKQNFEDDRKRREEYDRKLRELEENRRRIENEERRRNEEEARKRREEEDFKRREEYDRKRTEYEENRRRIEDEERRRNEEEARRLREEEDRKKKEETEMLIEKIKEQQSQLPDNAIVINGESFKNQVKIIGESISRDGQVVEREFHRIKDQIKGFKIKW